MKEALEANDWAQVDSSALSDFGDFEEAPPQSNEDEKELDPESLDFGFDRADFAGLRKAIWSGAGEIEHAPEHDKNASGSRTEPSTAVPGNVSKAEAGSDDEVDDDDVIKVERMMRKLQAAREAGDGMGEEQRRRMAARAVAEVMKEL